MKKIMKRIFRLCPRVSDLNQLLSAALGEAGLLHLFLQLSLHQHQLLLQLRHNHNIHFNIIQTAEPQL